MSSTGQYQFDDHRAKKLWNFVWLNLIAIVAMLGLFALVLYGDFMSDTFAATWRWFSDHEVVMALAASTPFFAALLVGRASSAKAKRKRLAAARAKAAAEAKAAREAREERRRRAAG